MKFTKTHEKQVRDYLAAANSWGVCTSENWVTGKGRFTKPRVLPPFTARFERKEYPACGLPRHGTTERVAYEFLAMQKNARRKYCYVMDLDALRDFLFDCARGNEF